MIIIATKDEDKRRELEILHGRIDAFERKMAAKFKGGIVLNDYFFDFEGEKEWQRVALHFAFKLTVLKNEHEELKREEQRLYDKYVGEPR